MARSHGHPRTTSPQSHASFVRTDPPPGCCPRAVPASGCTHWHRHEPTVLREGSWGGSCCHAGRHTSPRRWARPRQSLAQRCWAPERVWGVLCQEGQRWERHLRSWWTVSHPEGLLGGCRREPHAPLSPHPVPVASPTPCAPAKRFPHVRLLGCGYFCKHWLSPVPRGDTPSVPGWGRGAAWVAASGGPGRAAGRVRVPAAPLCSSKGSGTVSRGRRLARLRAAPRARVLGAREVAEDANPFPRLRGVQGTREGAPCGVQDPQHQSFPGAGLGSRVGNPAVGQGRVPRRVRTGTGTHRLAGASARCQHGRARVKVLAAAVPVTQGREECGKCGWAAMPREVQAGPGL